MVNLTVDEARTRAASVRVSRYEIALDLDTGDSTFESTSRVFFESLDGKASFFEVVAAELHSVELNGEILDSALLTESRFPLDPVAGSNVLTVRATMAYSHDGEGLHRTVDPEDGRAYVYAMTFLDAAPRVFACFDQPDLKAEVSLRVKVPDDWTVIGNGRAIRDAGEAGDEPTSRGWWTLTDTLPLSTYFVTLVAGPYHSVTTEHDGITLGLHCRESLAAHLDKDAEELFTLTGQCFDEYHRLFGIRYPFGDYHQAFVPEFNAGAMENPGCVTFADEHGVPRPGDRRASAATGRTSSPTRWPTSGSVTWSRCGGGTTSGSTSRSPTTWAIGCASTPPRSPTTGCSSP